MIAIAIDSKVKAISNVWWPVRKRPRIASEIIPLFLAFINSSFGFLHMLAEGLETRGLWVEYKKNHLQSLRIPDFLSWGVTVPEEVHLVLSKEMSRFDRFLSEMSNIERRLGSRSEAAKYVLNNPCLDHLSSRATLDQFIGNTLSAMYGIRVPTDFYRRLNQEVERLRKIMESRSAGSRVERDIGVTKVKRPKQKENLF